MKIYYHSGLARGTESNHNKRFYELLNNIQSKAVETEGDWSGGYEYETTYTMEDGTKYIYTENVEYGVPYSIEEITGK